VRLVCWNVNKRVRDGLKRQVEALRARAPDVVCLQEITPSTSDPWLAGLAEIGLPHGASTLDLVPAARAARRPSRSGVLTASRWPVTVLPLWDEGAPFPERQLSMVLATPGGDLEIHNLHIPSSGRMREIGLPRAKAETYEVVFARLARLTDVPRIVCGDLNAPLDELPDGTVLPWGPDRRTKAAELALMTGLAPFGLLDVYRTLYGYGDRAPSWYGMKRGYRLDHVLASASLAARACRYLDDLRIGRLSDHAPVEADFSWPDSRPESRAGDG
jgi:exonuclease III